MGRASKFLWSIAGMSVGGAIAAEIAHDRVRGRDLDETAPVGVVVLGCKSRRDGRPSPVQKFRVRLAIETAQRHRAATVVFTGAGEADVMAAEAVRRGMPESVIVTETEATNTVENVEHSAPLVDHCRTVILVSDPMHAERARGHWIEVRPHDADRVSVTDCVDRLEAMWVKVPAFFYETTVRMRHRRGRTAP